MIDDPGLREAAQEHLGTWGAARSRRAARAPPEGWPCWARTCAAGSARLGGAREALLEALGELGRGEFGRWPGGDHLPSTIETYGGELMPAARAPCFSSQVNPAGVSDLVPMLRPPQLQVRRSALLGHWCLWQAASNWGPICANHWRKKTASTDRSLRGLAEAAPSQAAPNAVLTANGRLL